MEWKTKSNINALHQSAVDLREKTPDAEEHKTPHRLDNLKAKLKTPKSRVYSFDSSRREEIGKAPVSGKRGCELPKRAFPGVP